jgi:replicative DNA helicase
MAGQRAVRRDVQLHETRASGVLGKNLPASIEAERSVLSAILLNEEHLVGVAELLTPSDFYVRVHQLIYQALVELFQEHKKVDVVVLSDFLERKKQLEEVGGISYLMELQEDIPSVGLIAQHAKIIKDKAHLRGLIRAATDIITACYDQQDQEVDAIIDLAEKKVFGVSNKVSTQTFVPLSDVLKKTFKRLSDVSALREGVTGVPTGFSRFDEMTSGMQRGDLLILAARPSMGKTALALNIATNAWRHGYAVGVFSLEMSAEQLVLRMLSSESGIPHQNIRNATIAADDWIELTNTAARLAEAHLYIDDSPTLSIMELRAKARRLKLTSNIQLLIIDYLQLLSADQRYENRTQEISTISRALKSLAKELDIPILALSQLSRSLESRTDKRPLLSDLRESGAIEQDGDVIFFVYRDEVYNPDTEHRGITELIIGKQRNGPIGTTYVRFAGDVTRFEDITEPIE